MFKPVSLLIHFNRAGKEYFRIVLAVSEHLAIAPLCSDYSWLLILRGTGSVLHEASTLQASCYLTSAISAHCEDFNCISAINKALGEVFLLSERTNALMVSMHQSRNEIHNNNDLKGK